MKVADVIALGDQGHPASRLVRLREHRQALFVLAVVVIYLTVTTLAAIVRHVGPDSMMVLAERVFQGHLDDPSFAGTTDSVTLGGRSYMAIGPLQLLPYLPFVPFPALDGIARYVASVVPGAIAASLALPLARAYGRPTGSPYWIATLAAFGTLLFYVSVFGDLYYLAHAESFLLVELFLLEWARRRRPVVLGLTLGVSFLARPTTVLAAIPFGLYLLWHARARVRSAIAFATPLILGFAIYGAFDWLRFGSPLESGYAISVLHSRSLIARRELGVFSLSQVPENLRLAFLQLPFHRSWPWIEPSTTGMSMLLVSPALLLSVRAGLREATDRLLWIAAGLVAVPVFLFYGGGLVQYGFRYSLDFTPFLLALVARGTRRPVGLLERILIVFSVASVSFGIVWHLFAS